MRTIFRNIRLAALLLVLAVLGVAAHAYLVPDVEVLAKTNPKSTAFMRHRQAQWAEQGKKIKISQAWVSLNRISPNLVKAVLIGEDDKFYQHEGFDFEAIGDALERNLEEGRFAAGASTITQQLAKNLFLSPDKSLVRKLREAVLVWRMERALSKKRILELYLNVAEWGPGLFGAEAASRRYYGKSASNLTPGEAAHLAAVLPNPLRYSPVKSSKYVAYRSKVILRRLMRRVKAAEPTTEAARPVSPETTSPDDVAEQPPMPVEDIAANAGEDDKGDDEALLEIFREGQADTQPGQGLGDVREPEEAETDMKVPAQPSAGTVPSREGDLESAAAEPAAPAPTLEEELYRQSLEELSPPSE